MKNMCYGLALALTFSSCGVVSNSPDSLVGNGYYFHSIEGDKQKVYVDLEDEQLVIVPNLDFPLVFLQV